MPLFKKSSDIFSASFDLLIYNQLIVLLEILNFFFFSSMMIYQEVANHYLAYFF